MPINDLEPDPEHQAFQRAEGYRWKEKPLFPYSAMRQAAAQRCGLKWGRASKEEIEAFKASGSYDGLFFDAIITLYVCLHDELAVMEAFHNAAAFTRRAMQWADVERLTLHSSQFFEAAAIFMRIMADIAASDFEIESAQARAPSGKAASHHRLPNL